MTRWFWPICGAVLMANAWSQCTGELHFALPADPKTLDPLQVTEDSSDAIRYLTTGTLVRIDRKTFAVQPELAKSWSVAPSGRQIWFKLRAGVNFSDGTPFDAEDVAYTLRRVLDPKEHVPAGDALRFERGVTSVRVLNRAEVVLTLPVPITGLDALFDSIPILSSRSALKERAGLGPFTLSEYKPGRSILLKRNANYWKTDSQGRSLPYLASIRIDIQQNREIELARYRRGELDFISNLNVDLFDQLGKDRGAVDAGPTFDSEVIWFNQVDKAPIEDYKKAWFRSQPFRRALSEAIGREDIAKLVYHGRATPAAGPLSPSAKPWADNKLQPLPFQPESALERLRGAGFTKQDGVLKDTSGHPVEFSLITNSGNRSRMAMATLIQQDLKRLGIDLHLVTLDMPSLIERITRSYQYEACLLGFLGTNLDPNDQLNIWLSSSSMHQWNPHQAKPGTPWEAEIDRLMLEQSASADATKRKALLDRFQAIVYEQAPMIYLVHPHALVAVSPKLNNAAPSVLRPRAFWNAEHLKLDESRKMSYKKP